MDNIKQLPPLEYLRSLVVFVESPNISRAAEALRISQPLLTQHLKALEEEMGEDLFHFIGRKKVLNQVGRELYDTVKQSLESLGSNIDRTMSLAGKRRHVRIGGRKEILDSIFVNLNFSGNLEFIPLGSAEIETKLTNRHIDIGIVQTDINSDQLIRKKLWSDEPVLCWHSSLKVSAKASVKETLNQLREYRQLDYGKSSLWPALAAFYKVSPERPLMTTFPDWKLIAEKMVSDKGWSVLPIQYAQHPALSFHRLPSELGLRTQFYVYYTKEFSSHDWFKTLIAQILNR